MRLARLLWAIYRLRLMPLAARAPHRQAIAATKQGASRPIAAAGSSSGAAAQPFHELDHPFIQDAICCNELV